MATIKTESVLSGNCPDQPDGNVKAVWGKWSYDDEGGGLINDIIQMVIIPKNARIIDIYVEWGTGAPGSSTFDVGDGGNDDRFLAAVDNSTNDGRISLMSGQKAGTEIGQGPLVSMEGVGYTYTSQDTIDITVEGANADAGDMFTMCVLYTVEGGFDDE